MDRPYPVRMLAYSQRFDMRPARAPLDRQVADLALLMDATRELRRQIDRLPSDGRPDLAVCALHPDRQADLIALCRAAPTVVHALDQVISGTDRGAAALWNLIGMALDYYGWPLPWLREGQRFYDVLAERHLRRADYLLLTWEPASSSAEALALTIQGAFQRVPTIGAPLPTILRCPYREYATALHPDQPGMPYLAGLLSYDMQGAIDATVLHDLMSRPYDLAIAIDLQTRSAARALAATERAYAVSRAAADQGSVKDARAERQAADSERALHELTRQNLHDVQIGVLVSGETRKDLEAHVAEVSEALGGRLKLMRPPGVQRQILNFWSTRPSTAIDIPCLLYTSPSPRD